MGPAPKLFLIAGPNGAGKTTYAFRHIRAVSGSTRFVNLDEIARGLSPLEPTAAASQAARVALALIRDHLAGQRSFTIETTLAGRTHLRTIAQARAAGFDIVLLYFAAPSPEFCLARVARLVAEGGHDVPEADVRRRFARSLVNVPAYARQADLWRVLNAAQQPIRVVAEGRALSIVARHGDGLPESLALWLDGLPPLG